MKAKAIEIKDISELLKDYKTIAVVEFGKYFGAGVWNNDLNVELLKAYLVSLDKDITIFDVDEKLDLGFNQKGNTDTVEVRLKKLMEMKPNVAFIFAGVGRKAIRTQANEVFFKKNIPNLFVITNTNMAKNFLTGNLNLNKCVNRITLEARNNIFHNATEGHVTHGSYDYINDLYVLKELYGISHQQDFWKLLLDLYSLEGKYYATMTYVKAKFSKVIKKIEDRKGSKEFSKQLEVVFEKFQDYHAAKVSTIISVLALLDLKTKCEDIYEFSCKEDRILHPRGYNVIEKLSQIYMLGYYNLNNKDENREKLEALTYVVDALRQQLATHFDVVHEERPASMSDSKYRNTFVINPNEYKLNLDMYNLKTMGVKQLNIRIL